MGVPALFRWLSQKYPKIVSSVLEEHPDEIDGELVPVDYTKPNPNGEEFDNLYLDMNGIVHPCSHPEDRPAPETEEEMMLEVFRYTERVVGMVRPRKLLMIAVDGVAPRAKMNQQRSRRFRSAQEAKEKEEQVAEFIKLLAQKGTHIDKEAGKKTWDSNAITPGTPFMDILSMALKYWVTHKINSDPSWEKMKVIISDSTVPGEGEHKIMEFVRAQRSSPDHDPNTHHVIYGLDADLIMLGLATHEPHFRVLREDVFAQSSKPVVCAICGQKGHLWEECTGKAKEKAGEFDEKSVTPKLKPFIWLHVDILREYLDVELRIPGLPFAFDLERAIDDWVFMCFFVGNDFLPHLPALEIREEGINTLIAIWRDNLPVMGGYVTRDGKVDLSRAQLILDGLAKQEDAIFRKRRQMFRQREESHKRRKMNEQRHGQRRQSNNGSPSDLPRYRGKGERPPGELPMDIPLFAAGNKATAIKSLTDKLNHEVVNKAEIKSANLANKSAAAALKAQLIGKVSAAVESTTDGADAPASAENTDAPTTEIPPDEANSLDMASTPKKRKADVMEEDPVVPTTSAPSTPVESLDEVPDSVRLWEPGYRDRYYEQKFGKGPDDLEFRHQVAASYVEGLSWVLLYYYQGCPSWNWYYPYHYAPFAQDFKDVGALKFEFELGKPFKPFEQLMGVLPAASQHNIPKEFRHLMTDPESEIIDFYPEDFPVDLNGKKFAWQGVVILPFIDEHRLLEAVQKIYPTISEEDSARNEMGHEYLFMSDGHPLYDELASQFFSKRAVAQEVNLDSRVSDGLIGVVTKDENFLPRSTLKFPMSIESNIYHDIDDDRSMVVAYALPKKKHPHKSMLLRGVKFNEPALSAADKEILLRKQQNAGRSYGGGRLYNDDRRGGHNRNGHDDRPISYAPPPGVRGPSVQLNRQTFSGRPDQVQQQYQSTYQHGQSYSGQSYSGYQPYDGGFSYGYSGHQQQSIYPTYQSYPGAPGQQQPQQQYGGYQNQSQNASGSGGGRSGYRDDRDRDRGGGDSYGNRSYNNGGGDSYRARGSYDRGGRGARGGGGGGRGRGDYHSSSYRH